MRMARLCALALLAWLAVATASVGSTGAAAAGDTNGLDTTEKTHAASEDDAAIAHTIVTQTCIANAMRDIVLDVEGSCGSRGALYDVVAAGARKFLAECLQGTSVEGGAFRPIHILVASEMINELQAMFDYFQSSTGFEVVLTGVPYHDVLGELLLSANTAPKAYDAWLLDTSLLAELVTQTNMVAPLDEFVANDVEHNWPDMLRHIRENSVMYNNRIYAIPESVEVAAMYYRKDILAAANLGVPNTWEDLLEAARILNGSDFDGDGEGDYTLCWNVRGLVCNFTVFRASFSQVLATLTQVGGGKTGWLFDPDNMQLLGSRDVVEHTLSLLQQFSPLAWPLQSCVNVINPQTWQGKCAITIGQATSWKTAQRLGPPQLKGFIGTAQLPGSTRVLDRATGQLVDCDASSCPLATEEPLYNGNKALVNRAPHGGYGGLAGMINNLVDPAYQKIAYDALSPQANLSFVAVVKSLMTTPHRYSHFDTSPAALRFWVENGYDMNATIEYLQVTKQAADHPNLAMDLRVTNSLRYMDKIAQGIAQLAGGDSPGAVATWLESKFRRVLADSGPLEQVQTLYKMALNVQLPSPPPMLVFAPQDSNSQDNTNMGLILGVTLPVVISVLAVVLVVLLYMRRGRRTMLGRPLQPDAGEETTLVVTDVEGSTALWEALPQDTMASTMREHHVVVRKAMARFRGYEQATEGDSFLMAFHTPDDALGFALELQEGLLQADWPEQLLVHPACAPVVVQLSNDVRLAGKWDGRFGLHNATSQESGVIAWDGKSEQACCANNVDSEHAYGNLARSSVHHPIPPEKVASPLACLTAFEQSLHLLEEVQTAVDTLCDHTAKSQSDGRLDIQATTLQNFLQQAWHGETMHAATSWRPVPRRSFFGIELLADKMPLPRLPSEDVTIFAGLRVRVGMHAGVKKENIKKDAATGRRVFAGFPLKLAQRVCDAGHGGQVLMTQQAFEHLHLGSKRLEQARMLCVGVQRFDPPLPKNHSATSLLYQCVQSALVPRIPLFGPLRSCVPAEVPAVDAPLRQATVVFASLVGMDTLLAWGQESASAAFETFAGLATQLLLAAGGYLVELTPSGLCLAAFSHPACALAWGLCLVDAMKQAPWDAELLEHELCEEVVVGEADGSGHVLFRGPRIKIGMDVGSVHADVSPVTGRMTYRGKVMNRAARISGTTASGMVWCSAAVWSSAAELFDNRLPLLNIKGTTLGSFKLKGVSDNVELVHCTLAKAALTVGEVGFQNELIYRRPATLDREA